MENFSFLSRFSLAASLHVLLLPARRDRRKLQRESFQVLKKNFKFLDRGLFSTLNIYFLTK